MASTSDNRKMSLRVGSVVMGASDVRRAMTFWGQALGYVPREEPDDTCGGTHSGVRRGPNISRALSETPVQARPRVHLDLYARDQAAEIDRLLGLGASRVDWLDYPEGADFVVLADTEGNRFCVVAHG
jgi:predicted enzyme related to lactoylglutathione lyase